jgi:hypothetical protein
MKANTPVSRILLHLLCLVRDHKWSLEGLWAGAFNPNEVAGKYERSETERHKNPDCEHLPLQTATSSGI